MASCDDHTILSLDKSDLSYIEPIGKGSFGTVFKVILKTSDGQSKEAAAKKIVSSKHSNDELMFMSKLKHKNIITFYGFIREKTELIIVTELASKGDLCSFLQKCDSPLPEELVKKWAREAAEGVAYLHQQKTVHKDIKSQNLLITSDDTLKLCDFGTVAVLEDGTARTSHREGTARWMAPEVIEKELRSTKSDVFSYGIVVWEICSRRIPFAELKTNGEIMDAIVEGKRPKVQDGCPFVLRKVMQSCWKKDFEERPSMDEVLDMLNNDQDADEDEGQTGEIEEEDEAKRDRYFESFAESMLKTTQKHFEKRIRGRDLMQEAEKALHRFQQLQTTQAKTTKEDIGRLQVTGQKPTDRRTLLEDKYAKMIAEKDKMRQDIKKSKASLADPSCNKMLEGVSLQLAMFAMHEAERMFQACYKSEEWKDEDLQSFTRMSTMHANIPDVVQEEVNGQVKVYDKEETTCDVFQLNSIPSEGILLEWNSKLEEEQCVFKYIETELGLFSLDSIQKILAIHKALGIKRQVKQDLAWFLAPPTKPTLMEKRPGSLKAFQNLVFHSKCDEILEGYGMGSEELAKVCCDHPLSLPIVQWFLNLLNQTQSEVFCICPQEQDATQQALCDLLEGGGKKPTALVLIFNVKQSGGKVTLRDASEPGSHFTLCHVNTLTGTVRFADSLGWPIPEELEENVKFYYQCIYEHLPELTVSYCHYPSSISDDNTHKCSHQCATYYPLQICHTICGPVVIILASLACLDYNMFLFLTTRQQYSNYFLFDFLHKPSDNSKYLRHVLGVWLGDRMIDVDYVTPKNFKKYQLLANFDPDIVANLHLAPLHPFIVPVPGLINVLIPEEVTNQEKDPEVTKQEEGSEVTKQETDNFKDDTTILSNLQWSGSESVAFDEGSIRSCSRVEVTRFKVPRIEDVNESQGRLVTIDDPNHKPKMTDVFQQSAIPDQKTLCAWQKRMQDMMTTSGTECSVCIETGEERYDEGGVENALTLHAMCQTQMDVHEELEWFSSYQEKPLATTKLPSLDSITKYRHLIHNNNEDEMLQDYQMSTRDLARICCNRELSENHIEWIVRALNSMQSKIICIHRGAQNSSPQSQSGELPINPAAMVLVFNVHKSDDDVKFCDEYVQGSHFTLCFVDIESRKLLYGDSLGWPAPEGIERSVSAEYERTFGSPLPLMETVLCHDTTFNTSTFEHNCSPICATYYPLHTCTSSLSGVVCCIMMAIACLAPEYFEFLTVVQYNKIFTGSLGFHMQHPALHANYFRRVLATWFAEKRVDVQHLVPEGFGTYKQLAVGGT